MLKRGTEPTFAYIKYLSADNIIAKQVKRTDVDSHSSLKAMCLHSEHFYFK